MKITTNKRYGRGKIQAVWEVRLPPKVKQKIRVLSSQRKCTMSWVARYCIFQLIQKIGKLGEDVIAETIETIKENRVPTKECERFYICFYGEDDVLVKLTAMQFRITVSMLVKMAFELYLHELAKMDNVSPWRFFWYGLKFNREVEFKGKRQFWGTVQDFLNSTPFKLEDYWGIPKGKLPKYVQTA